MFLKYMQHPISRDLTQKLIGDQVSIYRAMFMNKPPWNGTNLPYHQDGGSGSGLSSYRANQFVTVWTAIHDSQIENGCVQVIPGSHNLDSSVIEVTRSQRNKLKNMPRRRNQFIWKPKWERFSSFITFCCINQGLIKQINLVVDSAFVTWMGLSHGSIIRIINFLSCSEKMR